MNTVTLFNVPIVSLSPEEVLPELGSVQAARPRRLVFLEGWDVWRLLWSRFLRERWSEKDVLVVAATRWAVMLVAFATGHKVPPYSHFHTIIRILSHAENDGARVFLVDRRVDTLPRIEANLRSTFPGLHIAGRSVISKNVAESVQVAIKKSGAHFVLAGMARERRKYWLADTYRTFGNGLSIPAQEAYRKILDERSPFKIRRILRIFPYFLLVVVLFFVRVFSSSENKSSL